MNLPVNKKVLREVLEIEKLIEKAKETGSIGYAYAAEARWNMLAGGQPFQPLTDLLAELQRGQATFS